MNILVGVTLTCFLTMHGSMRHTAFPPYLAAALDRLVCNSSSMQQQREKLTTALLVVTRDHPLAGARHWHLGVKLGRKLDLRPLSLFFLLRVHAGSTAVQLRV